MDALQQVNKELLRLEQQLKEKSNLVDKKLSVQFELNKKQDDIRSFTKQLDNEQKDVDELTNFSLKKLFSNISGTLDEKLAKEQKELLDAEIRIQSLYEEKRVLQEEFNYYKKIISSLTVMKDDRQKLLKLKEKLLRDTSPELKVAIDECNREINLSTEQIFEIDQALRLGNEITDLLNQAMSDLREAEKYANMDIWMDSYFIKKGKRENVSGANQTISRVKSMVQRFETECRDIKLDIPYLKLPLDVRLNFFESISDSIWFEYSSRTKIRENLQRVQSSYNSFSKATKRIRTLKLEHLNNVSENQKKLKEIINK